MVDKNDAPDKWMVYSVGGGKIVDDKIKNSKPTYVFSQKNMQDVLNYYKETGKTFWELVFETEGKEIKDYFFTVWGKMKTSISNGLTNEGLIPGGLKLQRKAASYYSKSKGLRDHAKTVSRIFAYALAVSEENASGGEVVTACAMAAAAATQLAGGLTGTNRICCRNGFRTSSGFNLRPPLTDWFKYNVSKEMYMAP